METPYDTLAKDVLELLLSDVGRVDTESEAPPLRSQRADLLFVPNEAHASKRGELGTLGRMTAETCLLEAFHEAPSLDDVIECMRKLLNHRRARKLSHPKAAARTWLLCGGRPDAAMAKLHATPMIDWPTGFYDLGDALPLVFVVLSELPDDDDTLPLRVMGAGTSLRRALRRLRQRYSALPKGPALFATVVNVFLAARKRGTDLSEALMVDLTEAYEYMRTEREAGLRQGRLEGRIEGILTPLAHLCERKLARALTETERDGLLRRVERDGATSASDAVLDLGPTELAAWLRDAHS
ncbi:MAG: hypothetical protein U0326_13705 [Polyangiales bacterium]